VRLAVAPPYQSLKGASCASGKYDPDLWFSDDPAETAVALAICYACPVSTGCKARADQLRVAHGVWAGEDRRPAAGKAATA
jgi:hypothetical protein